MDIKMSDDIKNSNADVLIVNKFADKPTSEDLVNKYAPESFTGEKGQIFSIHTQGAKPYTKVVAIGLGDEDKVDNNVIRESVAKAIRSVSKKDVKSVAIGLDTKYNWVGPALMGAQIANYHFDKYKTKKNDRISELYFPNGVDNDLLNRAKSIADAMIFTRDLANEPASYATPSKLAEIAMNLEGIETKIFDKDEIEKMGMGAYLAVGQGSAQPPKFIHMKYLPQNPKKRIAIIGKGICFDSGGLDIKPASSMITMKDDMSGAACVLGIMKMLPVLNPNIEVHGIIAACENMPSGSSYKPGDIVKAMNGKTIEVDNTDAEGRLTLADALCYACELGVEEVVDIATLTGACMVALGTAASGIMGNNDDFVNHIIKKGKEVGEKFWQMPMWQEYRDNMDSDVADMKNTGTRYGGASAAGMFLKEFVTDEVKWAHLDVAGTAFLDKPLKEFSKGATGVGVRTLLKYIID